MREIIVLAACGNNEVLPQVRVQNTYTHTHTQRENESTTKQADFRLGTHNARHMLLRSCYLVSSVVLVSPCQRALVCMSVCVCVCVQSPDLPADVFTACLTTPIKVALRWFASRSLLKHDGITKELIDKIPGRQVRCYNIECLTH